MTNKGGYNPLHWDCVRDGCFNDKRRPKIEVFSECFPGNINFGDVDGIVEISGNMLLLEWKTVQRELPVGQRILYERMTKSSPITVMIVIGDAETMEVFSMGVFLDGVRSPRT